MHYLVLKQYNTLIWMHVPESLRLPSHACLHEWRLESQLARYILSSFLFFLDRMIDQAFNWRYLYESFEECARAKWTRSHAQFQF